MCETRGTYNKGETDCCVAWRVAIIGMMKGRYSTGLYIMKYQRRKTAILNGKKSAEECRDDCRNSNKQKSEGQSNIRGLKRSKGHQLNSSPEFES